MTGETNLAVHNLHDAFMNAHLLQWLMERTALPTIGEGRELVDWTISERGRLERLWLSMLYVLLEAWERNEAARTVVASRVDVTKLQQLIDRCQADGTLADLRETRHYMCHRDQREYWNDGRLAVAGHYASSRELMAEFSAVLLAALRAGRAPSAE